jgi:hypothetical protein
MNKRTLLFAPVVFDLAETTRMIEIATGIKNHPPACQVLITNSIATGKSGTFDREEGFPKQKLEPRFSPQKIESYLINRSVSQRSPKEPNN